MKNNIVVEIPFPGVPDFYITISAKNEKLADEFYAWHQQRNCELCKPWSGFRTVDFYEYLKHYCDEVLMFSKDKREIDLEQHKKAIEDRLYGKEEKTEL